MIAADTSVFIDFSQGNETRQTELLVWALEQATLVLPTPVFYEILSGPGLTAEAEDAIVQIPRLALKDDYWSYAGHMRRKLLAKKKRARGLDCLIAQNCIDHDVALITTDRDFRHFKTFGLKIAS